MLRIAPISWVTRATFASRRIRRPRPHLQRLDLAREAIRLTRGAKALLPEDAEVSGLLALMLLTDARRDARTGPNEELTPLDKQDRTLWDRAEISEGTELLTAALGIRVLFKDAVRDCAEFVHTSISNAQIRIQVLCCSALCMVI